MDYWVKAFLERPSFPTQETKKRFEVMDPVDVNTPELLVSAAVPCHPPGGLGARGCGERHLGGVAPTSVIKTLLMGFVAERGLSA